MSFIDDMIVNAAAAVDAMGKVATDVVDRSKVRVSSAELKNKISAQFEKLGRYIYDTHETGNTDPAVVNQYVGEITVLIGELKTLQDSFKSVNSRITCPKCRCVNSNDSLFCKKCGTSLDFANSYTVNKQPDIPVPVSSEEAAPTAEENAAPEE